MRSIRLLPIVIFAAIALLLFKGLGLMTSGGYVLLGTSAVEASGGGHEAPAESEGGDGVTMTMPSEPTMTDAAPTLNDGAPTLKTKEEAPAAHGEETAHGETPAAETGHGDPAPAADAHGETPAPATEAHGETPAPSGHGDPGQEAALDPDCLVQGRGPTKSEIGAAISDATRGNAIDDPCAGVDPRADGVPMIQNGGGANVPLATVDGTPMTEKDVLTRLAERRSELDAFEQELDMRLVLVEAAEKRIEERKQELVALEARINALVETKKTMEDGQFKALVGMYETMKPTEAAPIFDQLQMNVLLRLARGMNPRKMAPILARMNPDRAQQLTLAMAAAEADQGTIDVASPDLANLPQIVGH